MSERAASYASRTADVRRQSRARRRRELLREVIRNEDRAFAGETGGRVHGGSGGRRDAERVHRLTTRRARRRAPAERVRVAHELHREHMAQREPSVAGLSALAGRAGARRADAARRVAVGLRRAAAELLDAARRGRRAASRRAMAEADLRRRTILQAERHTTAPRAIGIDGASGARIVGAGEAAAVRLGRETWPTAAGVGARAFGGDGALPPVVGAADAARGAAHAAARTIGVAAAWPVGRRAAGAGVARAGVELREARRRARQRRRLFAQPRRRRQEADVEAAAGDVGAVVGRTIA